jgi:hypothetical protein
VPDLGGPPGVVVDRGGDRAVGEELHRLPARRLSSA